MENLIELLKKIITNVLTALYQPFWFAVILTVFLLFFIFMPISRLTQERASGQHFGHGGRNFELRCSFENSFC